MSNISAKTQQGNNWSVFLGLVLEDKEPGSKDIKVHLEELIPFVEGEVNPKKWNCKSLVIILKKHILVR